MAGKDELIYFDVKGRGEPIRMLYALTGVDFEDKRVTNDEWPAVQPSKSFIDFKAICGLIWF